MSMWTEKEMVVTELSRHVTFAVRQCPLPYQCTDDGGNFRLALLATIFGLEWRHHFSYCSSPSENPTWK
jgi:hypothetical protein